MLEIKDWIQTVAFYPTLPPLGPYPILSKGQRSEKLTWKEVTAMRNKNEAVFCNGETPVDIFQRFLLIIIFKGSLLTSQQYKLCQLPWDSQLLVTELESAPTYPSRYPGRKSLLAPRAAILHTWGKLVLPGFRGSLPGGWATHQARNPAFPDGGNLAGWSLCAVCFLRHPVKMRNHPFYASHLGAEHLLVGCSLPCPAFQAPAPSPFPG